MIALEEFQGTPMCNALTDMAARLEEQGMPPVELNVIGGFALMLRGYRNTDAITDIDYVGAGLSERLNQISREVGIKHGMEPGWINNDGMLAGDSMEDFELSTGELHFEEAFTIGPVTVNVLDEKDLLRLKVISIDTAMTEMEATGDFARRKDFADIEALMKAQGMEPSMVGEIFGEYILCEPGTSEVIQAIYESGHEGAIAIIDQECAKFKRQRTGQAARSPFLDALMDSLMAGKPMQPPEELRLSESDLDFVKGVSPPILS